MKKDNKRVEIAIVILLSVLCLTGILFAVKTSRNTGDEVLPQEGTSLVTNNIIENEQQIDNSSDTEDDTNVSNTTENNTEETENSNEETENSNEEIENSNEEIEISPLVKEDLKLDTNETGFEYFSDYAESDLFDSYGHSAVITTAENKEQFDGFFIENTTARGLTVGDSIDKMYSLYGEPEYFSDCTPDESNRFTYGNKKATEQYRYFLKIDDNDKFFYSLSMYISNDGTFVGAYIQVHFMEYWDQRTGS